jgi:hypothetical protein
MITKNNNAPTPRINANDTSPFESTIVVPNVGLDPDVAGLVVAHVIKNALPLRLTEITIGIGVVTLKGDAPPVSVPLKAQEFASSLSKMVREGRRFTDSLPRTAEG